MDGKRRERKGKGQANRIRDIRRGVREGGMEERASNKGGQGRERNLEKGWEKGIRLKEKTLES